MNGYLLDTHVFLWIATTPERLRQEVLRVVTDVEQKLFLSAASVWEIAQKRALGKLTFHGRIAESMRQHHLLELPITCAQAEAAAMLPRHHNDPFDRLLVAQAIDENLTLITVDRMLAEYGVTLLSA